jgi:hypothetical protein
MWLFLSAMGRISVLPRLAQLEKFIVSGKARTVDAVVLLNTIEQILFNQKDWILIAGTPLQEATEVIYEATDKRANELVEMTKLQL